MINITSVVQDRGERGKGLREREIKNKTKRESAKISPGIVFALHSTVIVNNHHL